MIKIDLVVNSNDHELISKLLREIKRLEEGLDVQITPSVEFFYD